MKDKELWNWKNWQLSNKYDWLSKLFGKRLIYISLDKDQKIIPINGNYKYLIKKGLDNFPSIQPRFVVVLYDKKIYLFGNFAIQFLNLKDKLLAEKTIKSLNNPKINSKIKETLKYYKILGCDFADSINIIGLPYELEEYEIKHSKLYLWLLKNWLKINFKLFIKKIK